MSTVYAVLATYKMEEKLSPLSEMKLVTLIRRQQATKIKYHEIIKNSQMYKQY